MIVFLNGDLLPLAEARISPEDRGFLFADGVYEVDRSLRGNLFLWEDHWSRMRRGLEELRIPLPSRDLFQASRDLLVRNGLEESDAIVYLQVTRGAAPRSHRLPPAATPATVYGFAKPLPDLSRQLEEGIAAVTGTTTDLTPVVRCDGAPAGPGRPGPLTRRLQAAFRGLLEG